MASLAGYVTVDNLQPTPSTVMYVHADGCSVPFDSPYGNVQFCISEATLPPVYGYWLRDSTTHDLILSGQFGSYNQTNDMNWTEVSFTGVSTETADMIVNNILVFVGLLGLIIAIGFIPQVIKYFSK